MTEAFKPENERCELDTKKGQRRREAVFPTLGRVQSCASDDHLDYSLERLRHFCVRRLEPIGRFRVSIFAYGIDGDHFSKTPSG